MLYNIDKNTLTPFELEITKVTFMPSAFTYENTDLYLFDPSTAKYTNRVEGNEELNVNNFPKVKPFFYDEFGNMFSMVPEEA